MKTELLVALGLVISAPSIAQTHICQPAVDAQLQKAGIATNRVTSTDVVRDTTGGTENTQLLGYTYWMRMKSCKKGHLLINLDENCGFQQIFTDSSCKIAGVPHC